MLKHTHLQNPPRRSIGGRYSNQMSLSADSPLMLFLCRELREMFGWAVTAESQGTLKSTHGVLSLMLIPVQGR